MIAVYRMVPLTGRHRPQTFTLCHQWCKRADFSPPTGHLQRPIRTLGARVTGSRCACEACVPANP